MDQFNNKFILSEMVFNKVEAFKLAATEYHAAKSNRTGDSNKLHVNKERASKIDFKSS